MDKEREENLIVQKKKWTAKEPLFNIEGYTYYYICYSNTVRISRKSQTINNFINGKLNRNKSTPVNIPNFFFVLNKYLKSIQNSEMVQHILKSHKKEWEKTGLADKKEIIKLENTIYKLKSRNAVYIKRAGGDSTLLRYKDKVIKELREELNTFKNN